MRRPPCRHDAGNQRLHVGAVRRAVPFVASGQVRVARRGCADLALPLLTCGGRV